MWQKNVRYLDYNASSGISGIVRTKLKELLDRDELIFANPSSIHRPGQQSRQLMDQAISRIASTLGRGIREDQLIFTSSGTEANQTVIRSQSAVADRVIIGQGEHSASFDLLNELERTMDATKLPLLSDGQYDFNSLAQILSDAKQRNYKKIFLSLFWANNETGVLTDLPKLEEVIKSSDLDVVLHLDGAQVWGKIELDLASTPAQFITFSGHKIGAPAGIGMIWQRPGLSLTPLIMGSQNRGFRGGTENLMLIVALSYAAEMIHPENFRFKTKSLRDRLERSLSELPLRIWGQESNRIENTCRFSVLGHSRYGHWIEKLDLNGFAVSQGSACKSGTAEPSRVLLAMGANHDEAINAIRVSLGPDLSENDIDDFISALSSIIKESRRLQ